MTGSFDILPCGYLCFKDDGIIVTSNSTLTAWLGYSPDELVEKSVESIFTIATRIFYNTHFFPLVKLHSRANEVFLSLKTKDNRDIPVLTNAERKSDGSDYIIHCIFIRIEERKKYEQEILNAKREAEKALHENKQLEDLKKALEQQALDLDKQYRYQKTINLNLLQFSKIISHDLQEPIRKIRIFMDQIINDPDTRLSTKSTTLSKKVDVAAERLKTLTTSLREYLTIDNEATHSEINLNGIIDNAKSQVVTLRQFSGFDMEVARMPVIAGYEKQMEILFFHLIDNAVQFRNPMRRLVIKINTLILAENAFRMSEERYKYTEHLRISFEDNGLGIEEEYKDYVFDLLNKVHNISPGVGIGLPLVKKIVQNHSGTIRLNSQPGIGTRFEIEFPVKVKRPDF